MEDCLLNRCSETKAAVICGHVASGPSSTDAVSGPSSPDAQYSAIFIHESLLESFTVIPALLGYDTREVR